MLPMGIFSFLNISIISIKNFNHYTLQRNTIKFIPYFIKVWMNLDKFTMVKVVNPLVNKDQWLYTSEFTNS